MADEPYRDANRICPILENYSRGSVFDLDSWTAAARSQHNNSVLIAVPVSSRPAGDSATTGFELGAGCDARSQSCTCPCLLYTSDAADE